MRSWWTRLIGAGVVMASVGCSDPTLAFEIRYGDPDPRPVLASLTLSVVTLPEHADGTPIDCDEVRFGRISPALIEGGRRAEAVLPTGVSATATSSIEGVPRLGPKLMLVSGRDLAGRRIAGGCTAVGDITNDQTVAIDVEIAPRIRLVGLDGPVDPSLPPKDFVVASIQPWRTDDGPVVALGGVKLTVDVRDRIRDQPGFATTASCTDNAGGCVDLRRGLARVPITAIRREPGKDLQPGPVEMTVRAPWIEEPVVVRAFEPLPRLGMILQLAPDAAPRAVNQVDPSWAVLAPVAGQPTLRAAALHVTAGASPLRRIVLVDNGGAQADLRARDIVVNESIRSLVTWRPDGGPDELWTLTASGWRRIGFANQTLLPGINPIGAAATEAVMVEPCPGDASPRGLLVRTDGDLYLPFESPGVAATSGPIVVLANAVNRVPPEAPGRIMAAACLTYPEGERRTLVVRRDKGITELIAGMTVRSSPIVAGFRGYQVDSTTDRTWRLAGATLEVTGPRLQSYNLASIEGATDDDGRLEGELTNLPRSTDLARIEDAEVVITSHEIIDESRIQMTFLPTDGRSPLTGISPGIRGLAPRVVVFTTPVPSGGNRDLIAVATSEALELLSLTPPRSAQRGAP